MTAISSTAEAAKDKFEPFFNDCITVLFRVFDTYTGKEYK